ncbi:MAG: ribosome silencing factor [Bacteroidota bacterium]|jgi:ribosome-associated protein
MAKKNNDTPVEALVAVIVKGLQEKKGLDICSLDLRKTGSAMADFFVLCHGGSARQVDALADSVEDEVRKALSEKPRHREGSDEAEWVLLDYVNVVVHVFSEEKRQFYRLEELWGDGGITRYENQN